MQAPSLSLPALAALLPLGLARPASAQSFQTLLVEGDPVPGIGNVASIGKFSSNVHGDWVVAVATDHPNTAADVVVLKNGAVILREGDAPAQPPGATNRAFLETRVNGNGDVAGIRWLDCVPASGDEGVYFNDNLVLQKGAISTAPGFSPGRAYLRFLNLELDSSNRIVL